MSEIGFYMLLTGKFHKKVQVEKFPIRLRVKFFQELGL